MVEQGPARALENAASQDIGDGEDPKNADGAVSDCLIEVDASFRFHAKQMVSDGFDLSLALPDNPQEPVLKETSFGIAELSHFT